MTVVLTVPKLIFRTTVLIIIKKKKIELLNISMTSYSAAAMRLFVTFFFHPQNPVQSYFQTGLNEEYFLLDFDCHGKFRSLETGEE